MKGVTVKAAGGPAIVHERPMPKLRSSYMLVKPEAWAINPADILALQMGWAQPGCLLGCDYAGTVVEVGEDVQRDFKKGQRVCGATRPADPRENENGTFAEYIVVKADIQLHIPDDMSFAEAASFGVTTLTTGRCFFDKFNLEYPKISENGSVNTTQRPRKQVLVYGGSSAMGTMVIQFAKLANFFVLSTSAPHNTDVVKSYGADVVVDHYSPSSAAELREIAKSNTPGMGKLALCVDNIGAHKSTEFCTEVLNPSSSSTQLDGEELVYSCIRPDHPDMTGAKTVRTIGYSFLGEPWEVMGTSFPASKEDFESAKRFAEVAEKLMASHKVKPHPVDVRDGGLEALISEGFEEMKSGKVSGKKLVYRL